MEQQENHSGSYNNLTLSQKEKVDAILGFLVDENTRSAEVILMTLMQEIKYVSKIEG